MKYLSICIPNYNRLDKLERLVRTIASQIIDFSLENDVQICISDDCSVEDPKEVIDSIMKQFPNVEIIFVRNSINMGMDYNFLNSVNISNSQYCWIIGNDDLPTDGGINLALNYLMEKNSKIDIMVTPFDIFTEDGKLKETKYPLMKYSNEEKNFNTVKKNEYEDLIKNVTHNSALSGFLSNTIFKRCNWEKYNDMFQDKLNTIFIQMYMNIQTIKDGAIYSYAPIKIINNYSDDKVDNDAKRLGDILCGLYGVIEYFFDGEDKSFLQEKILDDYVLGELWDLPMDNKCRQILNVIDTYKNNLYKNYFISSDERYEKFNGKNTIIYGAGNFGKKALKILAKLNTNIVAVIDSDPLKAGLKFDKYVVELKSKLYLNMGFRDSIMVVANYKSLASIVEELQSEGFEDIAIIT